MLYTRNKKDKNLGVFEPNPTLDFTLIEVIDNKVKARGLHQFLEIKKDFSDWIKNQIERLDLVQDLDYHLEGESIGIKQNARFEYFLNLDIAKEVAMISLTQNGKLARKYFIEAEKKLREIDKPKTTLELLESAVAEIKAKNLELEQAKPAIDFHAQVADASNAISVSEFAKTLGTGQNKLFLWLRNNGFLMSSGSEYNLPYQKYLDKGIFKVIEQTFQTDFGTRTNTKTLITGKGQVILANRYLGAETKLEVKPFENYLERLK